MNDLMMDTPCARQKANQFLTGLPDPKGFAYVILDEYTIVRPTCCVFFYESSRFIETGRFEDRLVGNAPILIDRRTGAIELLGTAFPVDRYIAQYEGKPRVES